MTNKPQGTSLSKATISTDNCYQSMPIHPLLQPYVKNIEIQLANIDNYSSLLPYRVLPDFSVVMGFQYQGSLYILENEEKKQLNRCGISGLQISPRIFQHEHGQTKTILVKFYPWAINALFNETAYHFTNYALGLDEVVAKSLISSLEDQLSAESEPFAISHIIQHFLIQLHKKNEKKPPPHLIISLAQHIMFTNELSSIEQLTTDFGVSKRNLERQFKNTIGLSPKKFIRLSQFQKTLHQIRKGEDWQQIIQYLNYYDQAHFINSFKEFSGLTPTQFIASTP